MTRIKSSQKKVNRLLKSRKKLNLDAKEFEKCVDHNCSNDTISIEQQRQLMKTCNNSMSCIIKKDNQFAQKIKKRTKCSKVKCKKELKTFTKSFSDVFNQANSLQKQKA